MDKQDKVTQEEIQKAKGNAIKKYYEWYCKTEGHIPYEIFLQEYAPKDH